jgi:hypothetical protein
MELIQSGNLLLRFLLEVGALVAVGYWGYQTGVGPVRWVMAVGLPVLFAVVWGVFVAPNAVVELPAMVKFILGLGLLELAAFALYRAGHVVPAVVFGIVAIVNAVLMLVWQQ